MDISQRTELRGLRQTENDGQPLFCLIAEQKYILVITLTFDRSMKNVIKGVKSVSIVLRNFENPLLQFDSNESDCSETKHKARVILDTTEEHIVEFMNSARDNDRKFEILKIVVEIEKEKKQLIRVPLEIHFTDSKDESSDTDFRRRIPQEWTVNNPHGEQDLEHSLLFCSLIQEP